MVSTGLAASFGILLAAAAPAKTPGPGPGSTRVRVVEIDARAAVMTAPRRSAGKNGRKLEAFEVELKSYVLSAVQPSGADRKAEVDMTGLVTVEHDLACGGEVALSVGDTVELRGEYVDGTEENDRIRFTHAPGARGCGDAKHPAGYLRKPVAATPATTAPPATPPRPSGVIPDQPWVGTPAPRGEAWAEIVKMKASGATEEQLLERIASEPKRYPLTTDEIQKLRDAGISQRVVEAMLRSGRGTVTPVRTTTPTPAP